MKQSYSILYKVLSKKFRLLHHLLFIFLIQLFWLLFAFNGSRAMGTTNYLKVFLYSCTYIAIAYLNIYVLFHRFFLKGKILLYIFVSGVTFVVSYVIQQFIYFKDWDTFYREFSPSVLLAADMTINAITYCMFIGIGLSVKMIKMWLNSELQVISLEEENLRANLSNLKSQLSPHFLFNTFNNLYVLTKTKPEIASEMILGFSDLLRYQLNESGKDKVSAIKEVEYIENFLALEQLRKDNLDSTFLIDRDSLKGVFIEPLIFIVLVENAVKHGSQQMDNPFIWMSLERSAEGICFEIKNSKPEISSLGKEESFGMGLKNLEKRLELCYPGKHKLELINQKNTFEAKLKLYL